MLRIVLSRLALTASVVGCSWLAMMLVVARFGWSDLSTLELFHGMLVGIGIVVVGLGALLGCIAIRRRA
jgi:hypothetical protein